MWKCFLNSIHSSTTLAGDRPSNHRAVRPVASCKTASNSLHLLRSADQPFYCIVTPLQCMLQHFCFYSSPPRRLFSHSLYRHSIDNFTRTRVICYHLMDSGKDKSTSQSRASQPFSSTTLHHQKYCMWIRETWEGGIKKKVF